MDIMGALLFLVLFIYFIQKDNKSYVDMALLFCVGIALVLDVSFVFMYFNGI